MLCLPSTPSSFSDLIFFYFVPSPFATAIVVPLLFLEYPKPTSASGPRHLLSFLLRILLSQAFACCFLQMLAQTLSCQWGSSLTMLYKMATHPISPIPLSPCSIYFSSQYIPSDIIQLFVYDLSPLPEYKLHEGRDFITSVLCCIPYSGAGAQKAFLN